jgi:flagellar protein FliS
MLLEGALGKIAVAKGHMERGEIQPKGAQIGSAISIMEGLKTSLDMEQGGEIARNLEDLYIYMERRLIEANSSNDTSLLDEVSDLLKQIKEAWDAIADQAAAAQQPAV